jgi:hypothetical protein
MGKIITIIGPEINGKISTNTIVLITTQTIIGTFNGITIGTKLEIISEIITTSTAIRRITITILEIIRTIGQI